MWSIDQPGSLFAQTSGCAASRGHVEIEFTPAPASPHRLSERPCSGTIRKSPWMATIFGAKDGRFGTGATIEPSDAERGRAGRKMLDDGRAGGAARAKEQHWTLTRCPLPRLPAVPSYLLSGATGLPAGWRDARGHTPISIERRKRRRIEEEMEPVRQDCGCRSARLRRCLGRNAEVGGRRRGRPRARPGRPRGPPGINSPPAPAPPSALSLHRLPIVNTPPPGPPKGTGRRPIAGATRSCPQR